MLCWDVFGILSSRCGDDTSRRILQSRCYSNTHTGTECYVHVNVTGVVRCTDFVVIAHWCGRQVCAPSTTQRSSLFAAALCEISGSFLIFPSASARQEPHLM